MHLQESLRSGIVKRPAGAYDVPQLEKRASLPQGNVPGYACTVRQTSLPSAEKPNEDSYAKLTTKGSIRKLPELQFISSCPST